MYIVQSENSLRARGLRTRRSQPPRAVLHASASTPRVDDIKATVSFSPRDSRSNTTDQQISRPDEIYLFVKPRGSDVDLQYTTTSHTTPNTVSSVALSTSYLSPPSQYDIVSEDPDGLSRTQRVTRRLRHGQGVSSTNINHHLSLSTPPINNAHLTNTSAHHQRQPCGYPSPSQSSQPWPRPYHHPTAA